MAQSVVDIGTLIRQIPSQYPFVLVDRVLSHDAATGLTAVKNVTGSEEFFEGHFPGAPVMPGVLIMESLAQAAGIWLLKDAPDPRQVEVHVVGIDDAKFRRPAVPGDELTIDVRVLHRRGSLVRVRGEVRLGDHRVAEARLLLRVVTLASPQVDPTARVAPGAGLGPGVRVGPYCVVGPHVSIGARDRPRIPRRHRRSYHPGHREPPLSVLLGGPGSPGSQVPGRAHPAGGRAIETRSASS